MFPPEDILVFLRMTHFMGEPPQVAATLELIILLPPRQRRSLQFTFMGVERGERERKMSHMIDMNHSGGEFPEYPKGRGGGGK